MFYNFNFKYLFGDTKEKNKLKCKQYKPISSKQLTIYVSHRCLIKYKQKPALFSYILMSSATLHHWLLYNEGFLICNKKGYIKIVHMLLINSLHQYDLHFVPH